MRMDELFASGVYDNEGIGIDIASTFELSMFEGKAVLCCGNATGKLFAIRKKRGGGEGCDKGGYILRWFKIVFVDRNPETCPLGLPVPLLPSLL